MPAAYARRLQAECRGELLAKTSDFSTQFIALHHLSLPDKRTRCCPDRFLTQSIQFHFAYYTRSDIEFHELLPQVCNNQMLQNMMKMVNSHLQIIRLRTVDLPGRAQKTVQEHHQITEAVSHRDADLAEGLMRQHIRSVRRVALENIDAMV
jgi:DNA-binding GntR family transcriptional regulator